MGQTTLSGFADDRPTNREWREKRLKEVLFEELPPIAQERGYVVVLDHCLARCAYDCACGGVWYDEVGSNPFYSEATDRQLQDALGIALRMKSDGPEYVARRNEQSLIYRGELDPQEAQHYHALREQ